MSEVIRNNSFRDELELDKQKEQEALESVIDEGENLLALESVTADTFHPRNALITIRRLGRFGENSKIGSIEMPDTMNTFDICEIIRVGRGTPGDNGIETDTDDLSPGDKVLVKTEQVDPQRGIRMTKTTKVIVDGEEIEIVNQFDILVIMETKETDNG